MAKIVLTVDTNAAQAKKSVDALKKSFEELKTSLSGITVNKDLTAQVNALTKYYSEMSKAAARAQSVQEKQQLAQQRLATETARTQEAEARLAAATERRANAQSKSAVNVDTLRKNFANLLNQFKLLKQQYPEGTFDNIEKNVRRSYNRIKELSAAYKENHKFSNNQIKILKSLSSGYKRYAADVAVAKEANEKIVAADPFSSTSAESVARLEKRYSSLFGTIKNISKYYPSGTFDAISKSAEDAIVSLQNFGLELQNGGNLSQQSQEKYNQLSTNIHKLEADFTAAKNSATNLHGSVADMVAGFAKWQIAAVLVMRPLQAMQKALQSINETLVETEKAVVSLQRVLNENIASGEISDELYDIAESLGQTFDVVQEIAQNFAKAGLDWQETLEATRAAVLALNVAELSAEEASEGLIAVMQQFGYEATDLTYIIDVLNKTADKAAVNTEELLAALQKTGSYAKSANLTFEETVALITAISEATAASGQNIGNALKSLFAYTSKDSALDVFAALSTDSAQVVAEYRKGAASILDVWKQVSEELQSLTAEQGSLLDSYFATEEGSALNDELSGELSDVYDSLKGIYDTAGTYRKNYFIALLANMEEVQNVLSDVDSAAGYTMEEQNKYMDTYEAKLNALQSQWQKLANDEQGILGVKKALVDVGSGLLTFIEWTGGLRTTFLALATVVTFVFGDKIIGGVKKFAIAIKNLAAGINTATTAAQKFNVALGWIGLAATAISTVVGLITTAQEKQRQAEEEARAAAISAWTSIESESKSLNSLIQDYNELDGVVNKTAAQEKEYSNLQDEIVDKLGYRAYTLNTLTKGTKEYNDELKRLTDEEKKRQGYTASIAANAYGEEFANTLTQNPGFFSEISKRTQGDDFASFLDAAREYQEYLYNTGKGNTDYFAEYTDYINQIEEGLNQAIEQRAIAETLLYEGGVNTLSDVNAVVNSVLEQTKAGEEYRDVIESVVREWSGLSEAVDSATDSTEGYKKAIENLTDTALEDLVDALKEARDLEDDSLELEEKKLSVIEAQKALEQAKNTTVRRFNAETGTFERVTDEKAVSEAEDNLKEATEALNEYIKDQAWDDVVSELESGNATNQSILAILEKWLAESAGGELPDWYKQIQSTIEKETGITLNAAGENSFDSGGVARGLGVMPKATSAPEAVNDPELTAKILSPVSNAQFDKYIRDMGILFENAKVYDRSPIVHTANNTTTNNSTDNSLTINGMRLGSDMKNRSLNEIISMMDLV